MVLFNKYCQQEEMEDNKKQDKYGRGPDVKCGWKGRWK